MAPHPGVAAHAHGATSEFILEAAIDTLHGGAFAVPHLLGQDQPGSAAGLRLCL